MMLKNDFKINLTSLILLFGLVFLLVICLRQCSDNRGLRKAYQHRISEFVILESNIVHDYEQEKEDLQDSIRYYKKRTTVIKPKKHRTQLEAETAPIEDEVKEIPLNNSYDLAIGSYSLSGALNTGYIEPSSLEELKCKDQTKWLQEENEYLVRHLQESGKMSVKKQREFIALERNMEQLQLKLEGEALKRKALKRKVWTNRSLAGVSTILLILVAL